MVHFETFFPDLNDLKQELVVDVHRVDLEVLCLRFSTDLVQGKTKSEVSESQSRYGQNKLTQNKTTPEWLNFCRQFIGGFSILLWAGSILCIIAYLLQASSYEHPPEDNLYLGIVLAVVVIITGSFSYYQERKSTLIMESFKQMIPQSSVCIRDGLKQIIRADELTLGDIIEVESGDIIPADIRILQASKFKVDNSSLTGESRYFLISY